MKEDKLKELAQTTTDTDLSYKTPGTHLKYKICHRTVMSKQRFGLLMGRMHMSRSRQME